VFLRISLLMVEGLRPSAFAIAFCLQPAFLYA
jgi:hypothetical protein